MARGPIIPHEIKALYLREKSRWHRVRVRAEEEILDWEWEMEMEAVESKVTPIRLDLKEHVYEVLDSMGRVHARFSNLACAAATVQASPYDQDMRKGGEYWVYDTVTRVSWNRDQCVEFLTKAKLAGSSQAPVPITRGHHPAIQPEEEYLT